METPLPTLTDHFFVRACGHFAGTVKPVALASRLGPRHCGQSWPKRRPLPKIATQPQKRIARRIARVMATSFTQVEVLPDWRRKIARPPAEK